MKRWWKRLGMAAAGLGVVAGAVVVAPQAAMAGSSTTSCFNGHTTTGLVYFSGTGSQSRIYYAVQLPFSQVRWDIRRYVTGYAADDPIVRSGNLGPTTSEVWAQGNFAVPVAAKYYLEMWCGLTAYGTIGS